MFDSQLDKQLFVILFEFIESQSPLDRLVVCASVLICVAEQDAIGCWVLELADRLDGLGVKFLSLM